MVKKPMFERNDHNFWDSDSNSTKGTFLIKTFRIIYNLFGFEEVRILLSFLVMTSL